MMPGLIELPRPDARGRISLERALATRRSVRKYGARHLTPEEVGQLLWAAQGRSGTASERTAPSAGALHPLELYALLPEGMFRYVVDQHRLQPVTREDRRLALATAALDQEAVCSAPLVLVIAGVYERTAEVYETRAPRYVTLEAGHAAQNVLLQAVALGLGAVPIGAFHDARVQRVLELPAEQRPLYLIAVGEPAD